MQTTLTDIHHVVTSVGAVVTAVGVYLAYYALKANHDWNRRQYAAKLVEEWNPQTSVHRQAIEQALPGLIDVDKKSQEITEFTTALAIEIYKSKSGDKYWELKFHLMELLNYFELVSTAYINGIADQQVIEDSFKRPLMNWHKVLHNFISVVKENRSHNPWMPYTELMQKWEEEERLRLEPRKLTA